MGYSWRVAESDTQELNNLAHAHILHQNCGFCIRVTTRLSHCRMPETHASHQFFTILFFLKKVLGLLSSIGASFLPDCTYRSLDISYPALFRDCSNNSISGVALVRALGMAKWFFWKASWKIMFFFLSAN